MNRAPYALREVAVVCTALVVGLLLLAPHYGPHRDELYFVAAGQHLAWGYADQPAFTPLLARLADVVAPSSVTVLRVPSALAAAGVVLLSAQAARLLGAARAGQVLTAALVGFSTVVPGLGHLLSTATFDLLCWTAVLVVVAQTLLDDRPRLWLLAGGIAGLGLNNKHAVAFCLLGVLVGVALVRETRPVLRTPWPWLGGLLALVMWLPNLVWQARHDWPVLDLSADIADEYGGIGGRVGLVLEAVLIYSPLIAVVWVLGLVQLLRRPAWTPARPLAIAFLVVLALFLVTGGKGYYLAGLIPPLVAAGATHLTARWPLRRLAAAGVVLVASAVVAYPAVLPVLPASTFAASSYGELSDVQLETIGWEEYTDQVRAIAGSLPATERRSAVIFTGNYGEAGAMSWYDVGLPVHSGHNGYREWGPPPESAAPVIVIGWPELATHFQGCSSPSRLRNDAGAPNEESEMSVWLCESVRGSWAERWPRLVHYSA